jgi:hypothetical protein
MWETIFGRMVLRGVTHFLAHNGQRNYILLFRISLRNLPDFLSVNLSL